MTREMHGKLVRFGVKVSISNVWKYMNAMADMRSTHTQTQYTGPCCVLGPSHYQVIYWLSESDQTTWYNWAIYWLIIINKYKFRWGSLFWKNQPSVSIQAVCLSRPHSQLSSMFKQAQQPQCSVLANKSCKHTLPASSLLLARQRGKIAAVSVAKYFINIKRYNKKLLWNRFLTFNYGSIWAMVSPTRTVSLWGAYFMLYCNTYNTFFHSLKLKIKDFFMHSIYISLVPDLSKSVLVSTFPLLR